MSKFFEDTMTGLLQAISIEKGNPFMPLSREEIYEELARARECFEKGEYKEFDIAIDEIRKKYGL